MTDRRGVSKYCIKIHELSAAAVDVVVEQVPNTDIRALKYLKVCMIICTLPHSNFI